MYCITTITGNDPGPVTLREFPRMLTLFEPKISLSQKKKKNLTMIPLCFRVNDFPVYFRFGSNPISYELIFIDTRILL